MFTLEEFYGDVRSRLINSIKLIEMFLGQKRSAIANDLDDMSSDLKRKLARYKS